MKWLSQAYGARWSAAFGHRDLRYNGRLWKPVAEHHAPEDMYFGLMDPSDGSSFIVRFETVDDLDDVTDGEIEASMAESIADDRFQARHCGGWARAISGIPFRFAEYAITNPLFGGQVMCHAYGRADGAVILVAMAWPEALPRGQDGLAVKFSALLDGLSL